MLFRDVREDLSAFYRERKETITGLLVALISKVPVFLFGPPGTAKSMMVRDLASRIGPGDWARFEWLLTKFSTPEELFGPVSMLGLEQDEFRRVTEGKLPEARIVFVDETFKASAGILNALLTVMNERKFFNCGAMDTPWELFVGASNETPQDPALVALYDRFLLRYMTLPIQASSDFVSMIVDTNVRAPGESRISLDQLAEVREAATHVALDQGIIDGVLEIRAKLLGAGLKPSDRRWKRSMDLVRARAAMFERDSAITEDLAILAHVMWETPEQRTKVERLVAEVANPVAAQALDFLDTIAEIERNTLYRPDGSLNPTPDPRLGTEANAKLKRLVAEIGGLIEAERKAGHDAATLERALEEAKATNRRVTEIALGVDMKAFERMTADGTSAAEARDAVEDELLKEAVDDETEDEDEDSDGAEEENEKAEF